MALYVNAGVVAVGRFNPAIFHPEWFKTHDLLPAPEIDAALGEDAQVLVSSRRTVVQFESLELLATDDRWQLTTNRTDWIPDIGGVVGAVFKHLPHTPVIALGLNRTGHFETPAASERLARWLPLGDLSALAGESGAPGAVVRARWRDYKLQLNVEPSERLKAGTGIFINQNYERRDLKTAAQLVEILDEEWLVVMERASQVIDTILKP